MKTLFGFFEQNFEFFFMFCLLWVVGVSLFFVLRRKWRGVIHPPISSNAIFIEKYASGFSHKSLFTRLGGAKNILVVAISNDAVFIEPIALLKWIMPMGFNDLEHYIPKKNIVSVQPSSSFGRDSIRLEFRLDEGEKRTVELMLRKPHEFFAALKS